MKMRRPPPVLIVEDDFDLCDCLRDTVEMAGYPVITARNGEEGLARCASVEPSLVLLDFKMPVMNGYEFVCALRAMRPDVPVVLMSAYLEEVPVLGGVSERLRKPFSVAALQRILRRYAACD